MQDGICILSHLSSVYVLPPQNATTTAGVCQQTKTLQSEVWNDKNQAATTLKNFQQSEITLVYIFAPPNNFVDFGENTQSIYVIKQWTLHHYL